MKRGFNFLFSTLGLLIIGFVFIPQRVYADVAAPPVATGIWAILIIGVLLAVAIAIASATIKMIKKRNDTNKLN